MQLHIISMELNFENFTIGQLRKLTEEFLNQNKDFETAQELLNKLKNDKEI